MYQCPDCGSFSFRTKGSYTLTSGSTKVRCICKECHSKYNVEVSDKFAASKLSGDKIVVTSCINNTDSNHEFFNALLGYCEANNATLKVIPIVYGSVEEEVWFDVPEEYLLRDNVLFGDVRILSTANIRPTIENPLAGLDPLCKGLDLIVGHPQVQLRTVPNQQANVITTTGTVSEYSYSKTKVGEKASFNHSYSALVMTINDGSTFMRHLNFDGTGFYDINGYYTESGRTRDATLEAIVTGDEHCIFADEGVSQATYGECGVVQTLKPNLIVRHDVLDCYSISHHHNKDHFMKFKKWQENTNRIEEELHKTAEYIIKTTPNGCKSLLVASNHNDHLKRWLCEVDIKQEPWNALSFHKLSYLMLDYIQQTGNVGNPFELWWEETISTIGNEVEFIGRRDELKIFDVVVSYHGDVGVNGSRGSLLQFSKLADKVIIGHSHSPGINKGAYQVGTSSKLDMEYVNGPSSWAHCHVLVYPNGKRQLLFIKNGKWC